jgi:hypothetical protein
MATITPLGASICRGGSRGRWTVFALVVLACSRPNPAFMGDGATLAGGGGGDEDSAGKAGAPRDAGRPEAGAGGSAGPSADAASDGLPADAAGKADTEAAVIVRDGSAAEAPRADASPEGGASITMTNGLVGYWPLDEGTGTTAADRSVNRNHGRLILPLTGSSWKPGRLGTSIEIPDQVGAAIRIEPSTSIDSVRTGLTLAAWVYRSAATVGSRNLAVISRQLEGTSRELYALTLQTGALTAWMYTVEPAPNTSLRATRGTPVATWFHAALTWDGKNLHLYQDGTEVGTATYSATIPTSANPLLLGNNANTSGIDQPLVGRLDEVRLYNRALSRTEIVDLMTATSP